MFEHILIPTDGSDPSRKAARKGIDMAAVHGATVHLMYAMEPIPLGGFTAGPEPASAEHSSVVEKQREEGQEAIDDVASYATEVGVDVVEAIEGGRPSEAIVEYVEDEGIDLVVMGTHGRSGAGRLMLGSVAEKVVRRSPVPVMTVKAE